MGLDCPLRVRHVPPNVPGFDDRLWPSKQGVAAANPLASPARKPLHCLIVAQVVILVCRYLRRPIVLGRPVLAADVPFLDSKAH
jgi:hypothetical protein